MSGPEVSLLENESLASTDGSDVTPSIPSTSGLTPIGADEPEAQFISRRSQEFGQLFRAHGVSVDILEAQSLIVLAFGVLIVAGAPLEAVSEYCQRVWAALEAQIAEHKAQTLLAMRTSGSVN